MNNSAWRVQKIMHQKLNWPLKINKNIPEECEKQKKRKRERENNSIPGKRVSMLKNKNLLFL